MIDAIALLNRMPHEEFTGMIKGLWLSHDNARFVIEQVINNLPTWKKLQFDANGKPVIPENSVVRDGYYIDIISLDRLPKED